MSANGTPFSRTPILRAASFMPSFSVVPNIMLVGNWFSGSFWYKYTSIAFSITKSVFSPLETRDFSWDDQTKILENCWFPPQQRYCNVVSRRAESHLKVSFSVEDAKTREYSGKIHRKAILKKFLWSSSMEQPLSPRFPNVLGISPSRTHC